MNSELQSHLNRKPGCAHKSGAAVVKQVAGSIQWAAALDEIREATALQYACKIINKGTAFFRVILLDHYQRCCKLEDNCAIPCVNARKGC